jgi:hypothetical protein
MEWVSVYTPFFTFGNFLIAAIALVLSVVSTVLAVKAYRARRIPIGIEIDLPSPDTPSDRWHRCVVAFRNELTVAVDVVEVRSKRPERMLICVGMDDGRIPMPDLCTYSARLLPNRWRIPPATDRWGELTKTIFLLRPTSLRLGQQPRRVQLEVTLAPLGGKPRQIRISTTTPAIIWS